MENKFLSFYDLDITGGFWYDRQKLNSEITIKAVYDRFKETGRFEALKQNYKEGQPNRPHIFYDSDVAKWIEAAAYIYKKNHDESLLVLCEETIDDIERTQAENGYFNIHGRSTKNSKSKCGSGNSGAPYGYISWPRISFLKF